MLYSFVCLNENDSQRRALLAVASILGVDLHPFSSAHGLRKHVNVGELLCVFLCDPFDGCKALNSWRVIDSVPPPTCFLLAPSPSFLVATKLGRLGAEGVFTGAESPEEIAKAVILAMVQEPIRAAARLERSIFLERVARLSVSEREVLRALYWNVPNKTIAKRQYVSQRTIEARRQQIYKKLGVESLADVVRLSARFLELESLPP